MRSTKKGDSIDLVIFDMTMPDMGGTETYDRLKDINPNATLLLLRQLNMIVLQVHAPTSNLAR